MEVIGQLHALADLSQEKKIPSTHWIGDWLINN
jgi:hypothetical protein